MAVRGKSHIGNRVSKALTLPAIIYLAVLLIMLEALEWCSVGLKIENTGNIVYIYFPH